MTFGTLKFCWLMATLEVTSVHVLGEGYEVYQHFKGTTEL